MIFKRRRQRACQQARLWLTQRAEDGLADKTAARLETHLAGCPACREWSRPADSPDGRLLAEQPAYRRLTPADAAHIRSRIHQGIWRKSIMLQTRQALQGAATLIVLAALTAVFIFWQRQTVQPLLDATPTAGPVGRATLTLAVPDGASERYRALAEAFMADNEGVTIHVESMNRLTGSDPNPARALAQAADIFPSGTAFAGDWQSLTLDLTPLANAADFDAADFPAGLLYAADGAIRHLPAGIDVAFVAYNKTSFDNAGLPHPTPDWTWEEFLSLAAQLTERYGDLTVQYGWADGLNPYGLVGAGLSTSLADYATNPPTPRLAEDEVVTAITRYLNLFGDNGVAPTPLSAFSAPAETQSLIQDRRAAMWLASSVTLDGYGSLNVGVLPLPIINGQTDRRLYLFGQGFAVSAATQHPQIAWQLLEFLSRQPGYYDEVMPARTSVRQATGFWDGLRPEVASLVEQYLDRSFALPYAPTREAVRRAVVAALLEETDLTDALVREEMALQEVLAGETEPLGAVVAEAAPVSGSILFIIDGLNVERDRALAQAFEAENPHLRVEVSPAQWTHVSGEGFRSIDRGYGGRQADCFTYGPLQTETEAARALALDALLELDPTISRDDFYPIALSPFVRDGAVVGLPYYFQTYLLGYDTALFDAAGVAYPEADWTLAEFLETAVTLTTGEGREKQYGYVPHQADYFDALLFLLAFGVDLLDHSVDPPTANFDTSDAAEALRWYVALSETYGVKPVYLTNSYDFARFGTIMDRLAERRALFSARRGAMWINDGSESEGAYRTPTAAIEERQYTLFPTAPGVEAALPATATGLYISAETEQREACWQWLTFLLEHDTGYAIPARQSVAQSEAFRLRAGPATEMMLQNAARLQPQQLALLPEWMNLWGWYSIALTRVLEEDMTAEEALAVTQAEFELYYDCVLANELFAPTHSGRRLLECALPASSYVTLRE
jgi:ABC-type glycerol-3-phosphate transport system substrate-binding protein